MDRTSLDMLSGLLWRERDTLTNVIEGIDHDVRGAELFLRSLSSLELHRAILAREVAAEHDGQGESTLADLIDRVPAEWAAVLSGHRQALLELTDLVDQRLAGIQFPVRVEADDGLLGNRALRTRPTVQRSLVDFLA